MSRNSYWLTPLCLAGMVAVLVLAGFNRKPPSRDKLERFPLKGATATYEADRRTHSLVIRVDADHQLRLGAIDPALHSKLLEGVGEGTVTVEAEALAWRNFLYLGKWFGGPGLDYQIAELRVGDRVIFAHPDVAVQGGQLAAGPGLRLALFFGLGVVAVLGFVYVRWLRRPSGMEQSAITRVETMDQFWDLVGATFPKALGFFNGRLVLLSTILPAMAFAYEWNLDRHAESLNGVVVGIHAPPTADARQQLVEFLVSRRSGGSEPVEFLCDDGEIRSGRVALGKPVGIRFHASYPGGPYRLDRTLYRWQLTIVMGVIVGIVLLLAVVIGIGKRCLK